MKHKKIALILSMVLGCMTVFPNLTYADTTNGWAKSNGTWYFYENGNMKTGWVNDGGSWYYLKSDGSMACGWQKVNGTWYYLNASGAMKTGWLNDGGTWYYLNDDGSMATGWKNVKGTWYYLNSDGSMKTGWLKDGAYWYYLNNDGSMAHDTVIDNYVLNSNGQWEEEADNMEQGGYISQEQNDADDFLFALNKFSVDSSSLVLNSYDKNKNCMYSPTSVFMALSVLSEGAGDETRNEILNTLNVDKSANLAQQCKDFYKKECFESETGKCSIADSIWLNNSDPSIKFKDDVLENISKQYGAGIFKENFSTDQCAEKIVDWVDKNTYGMIKKKVSDYQSNPDAMIRILNAIYFQDKWSSPFYESATQKDKFTLSDGSQVDADFMNDVRTAKTFTRENEFKVSSLSFKGGNSMAFILPAEGKSPYDIVGNKDKLKRALSDASSVDIKGKEAEVTYKIPKFEFASGMDLNDSMIDLGLGKLFGGSADFSKFTEDVPLEVSSIIQDSKVVVDESGAKAAAVTEITLECGSAFEETETDEFILDKPFIFVIMDKDNTPLFIGVVNNPTLK